MSNRFNLKKEILILSLFLIIGLAIYLFYSSKSILYFIINQDTSSVVNYIDSFGIFSILIFVFLVILEVVFAPIPALGLYVAGGLIFGTFFGGVIVLIGNIIGASIDFEIGRKCGRNFFRKNISENVKKRFDSFSEKYGAYSLFFLRINPLTSSDLFSYLAGISKMKRTRFLLGTIFGLAPLIYLQTYFGEFFVKNNNSLFFILKIITIGYLLLTIYLLFRFFSKKTGEVISKKKITLTQKFQEPLNQGLK